MIQITRDLASRPLKYLCLWNICVLMKVFICVVNSVCFRPCWQCISFKPLSTIDFNVCGRACSALGSDLWHLGCSAYSPLLWISFNCCTRNTTQVLYEKLLDWIKSQHMLPCHVLRRDSDCKAGCFTLLFNSNNRKALTVCAVCCCFLFSTNAISINCIELVQLCLSSWY